MGVIGQYKKSRSWADLSTEEQQQIVVFVQALSDLAQEDRKFGANWNSWLRMNDDRKLAYSYWLEEQAEKGLPIAMAIIARVAINRLTS